MEYTITDTCDNCNKIAYLKDGLCGRCRNLDMIRMILTGLCISLLFVMPLLFYFLGGHHYYGKGYCRRPDLVKNIKEPVDLSKIATDTKVEVSDNDNDIIEAWYALHLLGILP